MLYSKLLLEAQTKPLAKHIALLSAGLYLLWSFCLGVRAFFRQEGINPELITLLYIKTLPTLIPFIVAIAFQLTVIHMVRRHEWSLLHLLGISIWKRYLYFSPAIVLMICLTFAIENQWKIPLKQSIQNHFIKEQIEQAEHGYTISLDQWTIKKTRPSSWVLWQDQNKWVIRCKALNMDPVAGIQMVDGIFHQTQPQQTSMSFKLLQWPTTSEGPPKPTTFIKTIRHLSLPIFTALLGLALARIHLAWGFSTSLIANLFSLFIVYFPLQLMGKNIDGVTLGESAWLFAPHLACCILSVGTFLTLQNNKAQGRGQRANADMSKAKHPRTGKNWTEENTSEKKAPPR